MKKLFLSILIGLFTISNAYAGYLINPYTSQQDAVPTIEEEDGSPSVYAPYKLKVPNTTLTDNADGSVSITTGGGDVTDVGDCATGACFTGTSGNTLTFKGATSGTTTLKPTAVAGTTALALPAETGTVLSSATTFVGDVTGTSGATVIADSVAVTSWNLTTPTLTTSATVTDAFTLGLGTGKGLIQFDDETTDFVSFSNCNVGIGTTAPVNTLELGAGKTLGFEGATDDNVETIITVVDPTTSDKTITFPDKTGTVILGTDIDTSAELLAILGDETGTGLLTFATSPNFTTSISFNGDPADTGAIRLSNANYIYSEASPAGTDISVIGVDATEIIQIGASGASGVAITPTVTITDDLTVNGDDIQLGATGVKITDDTDGAITFLGLSAGFDESLTFNFDDVANTVGVTSESGVTKIDFGALNLATTVNQSGEPHHFRATIIDPATAYGKDTQICIVPKLDAAITVTNLEVTCNADPTTEPTGDIKYADTFIGLANATVINDFDTTAGVRTDSTITSGAVATGKAIYIQFDTTPDATLTQMSFDLTWDYD